MSARRVFLMLPIAVGCAALAAVPAAAQAPEVKIQVTAKCEGGDAQFNIVNDGATWPQMAMISILRTDNRAVISQRQMRMAAGQRTVFRAREAPDGIEVGLRIEPEWYKRAFAYDATITCADSPAPAATPAPAPAATPTPAPAATPAPAPAATPMPAPAATPAPAPAATPMPAPAPPSAPK